MRWVTYRTAANQIPRAGLVDQGTVRAPFAATALTDLIGDGARGLADAADRARRRPAERLALADVELLAPVPTPPAVRDFMSFEAHVVTALGALSRQVDPVWYQQPVFYFSNPAAVLGPYADVAISPGSLQFDYELEVAAVIGRAGSDIEAADAESHIAGYTVLCDWSARDLQETEMRVGLGPAKGKDSATSLGPFLVTADEIEPWRTAAGFDLRMTARVNGELYSSGNWSDLYWSFPQMISYASRGTTLRTGDVIGAGTVGTGCILELSRAHGESAYPYLREGDVVDVEIDQLGSIRSTVRAAGRPARPTTDQPVRNL